jgi:Fe-S-cluster containining protein
MSTTFLPYQNLKENIENKWKQILASHATEINCKEGCHECCHPELTVGLVEALAIFQAFQADPNLLDICLENEKKNPFNHQRCSFLNENGNCLIYSVRPVVCATHGAPILIEIQEPKAQKSTKKSNAKKSANEKSSASEKNNQDSQVYLDACHLNFPAGIKVQQGEWFNQETLSIILNLLNQHFNQDQEAIRISLKPSAFVNNQILATYLPQFEGKEMREEDDSHEH